jgi:uncharacterized cupin superfamily protein
MTKIASFSADQPLTDAPIEAGWITKGKPEARNRVLCAARDGSAWTMLWECSAGSFAWHYTFDETIHFLEGGARITGPDGITHDFGPGDMAFFPTGTSAHWSVDRHVKKLAFCHLPAPFVLRLPLKITRRLGRLWQTGIRLVGSQISGPAFFEPAQSVNKSTKPQAQDRSGTAAQPVSANRRA